MGQDIAYADQNFYGKLLINWVLMSVTNLKLE